MAVCHDADRVRISGIHVQLFLGERNRLTVGLNSLGTLARSPVVAIGKVPPQDVLGRAEFDGLFVSARGLVVTAQIEIGIAQIAVGRGRGPNGDGPLQHADGIGVAALRIVSGAEVVIAANAVWGESNYLGKHGGCVVVAGLMIVKGSEPTVAGPVVRA